MTGRPLIGVTTRRLPASALGAVPPGVADAPLEGVFSEYAEAVAGAGGVPILLPRSADAVAVVDRLDGLVLAGGEDVEPHRYGATPGPHATAHDPGRDEFEIALVHAAIAARRPILAICRGIQVLNVALGGTLREHLEPTADLDHATTDAHRTCRRHQVIVRSSSLLADALGGELDPAGAIGVNSFHHQAVDRVGQGLRVAARAEDGIVEAVEDPDRRILGVQWHPEMHAGVDPVFVWFVEQINEGKWCGT